MGEQRAYFPAACHSFTVTALVSSNAIRTELLDVIRI